MGYFSIFVFLLQVARADGPSEAFFSDVRYSGSGCPRGTASITLSPDRNSVSVLFDKFTAESSDRPGRYSRLDCAIDLDFQVEPGWQFSVVNVEYRGYAALEKQAWGRQISYYKFLPGGFPLHPSQVMLKGPFDDNYYKNDEKGFMYHGFSPCSKKTKLRIETIIQVGGAAKSQAMMTVDSIDGTVRQSYEIQWRKCMSIDPRRRSN